ncbi:MAG TPA: 50S ribosomal protein L6 [Gammaproteobacteria bacterium]|nr:50S ribosomal protein L6 [Gammaproteobacteria bacterium]
MSRIANSPVSIPSGVEVKLDGQNVEVKGPKGNMSMSLHTDVAVEQNDNILQFKTVTSSKGAVAMTGTMRSLVNNMVTGVSKGFEKKLLLVGVGYRAQAKGTVLNLTLGFSHPIDYNLPEGVTVETPSQTEVILTSCDKQKLGQVAAEIRSFRPPEPYKGKGVKYADEIIVRKEAKKK